MEADLFNFDSNQIKKDSHLAKTANFADLQTESSRINSIPKEDADTDQECLKSTSFIPQSVYDNLPPILFESCKVFNDQRSKDTFLTGALAILSGCLPNVSGTYSGSVVYPNLFSFILAPAGSGKGSLNFAKSLGDAYHNRILAQNIADKKKYDEEVAVLRKSNASTNLSLGVKKVMPEKSNFKVVFIPANTSNSKIIQHLESNEGKGIICETEADALGQTFKNDWGSYSDMLRKAFHHEKISYSRKMDSEFVEVDEPKLSVALSGTLNQVFNIIPSAEDGLFSRFVFYVFKSDAVWIDPSPKGHPVNLTNFFSGQSAQVLKMVEFFENNSMIFYLTAGQWKKLNTAFSFFLEQIRAFVSEDAQSVVKRLGLILYRFCMIFTAIRGFFSNTKNTELYCTDQDFQNALTLVGIYLEHSVKMFSGLPKQREQSLFKSGENKKKFFDDLPISFTRKEAVDLAKKFHIAERTVDELLKTWVGTYIRKTKFGVYSK